MSAHASAPHRNDRIGTVKNWVEISESRLRNNYNVLAEVAGPESAVLAVVKANAYGHGACLCAPILARAGAHWLGVTDVAEGIAVRHALLAAEVSPSPSILVMSGMLGDDAEAMIQHRLTPVVWTLEHLNWLAEAASHLQISSPLPLHIEIDTGMARQGVAPGADLDTLLHHLKEQPNLHLDGVMTHFASAEVADSPQTLAQRNLFEQVAHSVITAGLHPTWLHAGNSSTVDNLDTEKNLSWLRTLAATTGARSMVRAGLALYGYCLPIESATSATPHAQIKPNVYPVMTWKTRIIDLRDIHPGATIGYNAIFSATHPMRLALLPLGYADGLRRELSGSNHHAGGWAMVQGRRAPIVGRVSMNLTIVDVTGIPGVSVGDEAIVLGDDITADDHAQLARTIAYEIVCGVRSPSRIVLPDGPTARGAITS
jgi:alanine racemase